MTYRLKVEHDDYPFSPREDCDNLGTMVCFHRNYNLGDEHDFKSPGEVFVQLLDEHGTPEEKRKAFRDLCFRDCLKVSDVKELIKDYGTLEDAIDNTLTDDSYDIETVARDNIPNAVVVLPIFGYEHGGITLRCSPFSCGWDSGQAGVIYTTVKKAQEWLQLDNLSEEEVENRIAEVLVAEVDTYDKYLTGQIFCFVVEKEKIYTAEDGDTISQWEVVDSCGGFYDEEDCKQEGLATLKYYTDSNKGESSPTP